MKQETDMSDQTNVVPYNPNANPYLEHGAKEGDRGTFLAHKNGEYLAGPEKNEVPLGTRLVADMPGLRLGWVKWSDKQIVEDRQELLASSPDTIEREELGDLNDSQWEKDDKGQPRDPWQYTNSLGLADPNSGEQYLFSTSSNGGKKAIANLCKSYGMGMRMHPNKLPVIELARDFYMHKKHGKTYVPVLKLVDWVSQDGGDADDDEPAQAQLMYNAPREDAGQGQRVANPMQAASAAAEIPRHSAAEPQPISTTKSPSNGRRVPKF